MKPTHVMMLCLVGTVNHANSKLVINEIMIAPSEQIKNPFLNWFELYNTAATTVPLDGWVFEVCQASLVGTPGATKCSLGNCACLRFKLMGLSVFPNDYFVVGNVGDPGGNSGLPPYLVTNFPHFDSSGAGFNSIAVFPPNSQVADDTVYWSAGPQVAPFIVYQPVKGSSLAKVDPLVSSEIVNNWKTSTAPILCKFGRDRGTPYRENTYDCPKIRKLVINEIMMAPTGQSTTNWLELYNT
jgi:hypothetical protein